MLHHIGTGLLGLYNVMSGGAFATATVFALSIQPYINSSIIIQLLTVAIPALERLARDGGEEGKKKIQSITRYATVAIAILQAIGYYFMMKNYNLLEQDGIWVALVIIVTLIAGSSFVMWMGEQVTEFGVGNGISIILFAGILARIPSMISGMKDGIQRWSAINAGTLTAETLTSAGYTEAQAQAYLNGALAPWSIALLVIGMLAIENTIAGSLLHNNELLRQSGTQIIGEYKLRISHSFVCLPEEDWNDITEVNSHPIALMQCREFLNQHPRIKVVEAEDTALSAEIIKRENLKGHAAICSRAAAERYGMKVLQEGIETNKHNFTRFLVVADPWQVDEIRKQNTVLNKANIVFTLPHSEGSLSQVLSILSFYNINLTKIQSLPIIGREWEYQFYVDVAFNDYLRYKQSITAITPLTKELKILGEYAEGKSNV